MTSTAAREKLVNRIQLARLRYDEAKRSGYLEVVRDARQYLEALEEMLARMDREEVRP